MPTGNRFGIDLGNILSQASTIKSAKLQQEKNALLLKKEEAGTKLKANVLAKRRNVLRAEEADESMQGGMEGGFAEQEPTLSEAEYREASSIAPEVAKIQEEEAALAKFYEKQGVPKDEALLRSGKHGKAIREFKKEYLISPAHIQEAMEDGVAQQGAAIQDILIMSKENPMAANETFLEYRKDVNEKIKELLKLESKGLLPQKDKALSEKLQNSLDNTPESLIKKDGTFDTTFLMTTLSTMSASLQTVESFQKGQTARAKATESAKGKSVKIPQVQKDIFSIRRQIDSFKAGVNIMNEDFRGDAIKSATSHYKQKLTSFRKNEPEAYIREYGEIGGANDPLSGINQRDKEVNSKNYDFPDGYSNLSEELKKSWKDYYTSTGDKLEIEVKDAGWFSSREAKLKDTKTEKKEPEKTEQKEGTLFKEDGKVYKIIKGKKVEMRKKA